MTMAAAVWRVRTWRESAREGESKGGRRGDVRVLSFGGAGREAVHGTEVGCALAMVGARSVHDHHEDILPNTRHARTSPTSGPIIGIF